MSWLREIDRWFIDAVLPHRATYYASARRLGGGQAEAEDLVQEAYARVLAHADWRGIDAPRAFVLRVIHNLGIERIRRSRVVAIGSAQSLDRLGAVDDAESAEVQLARAGDIDRLRRALQDLPPQCGKVVRLRKLEGMAPRDIAQTMGISLSTVEKHLAHGVRLLTVRLASHEPPETKRSWPANRRTEEQR
jgi:RNA polymerase sigma factor (sigma-70 family)